MKGAEDEETKPAFDLSSEQLLDRQPDNIASAVQEMDSDAAPIEVVAPAQPNAHTQKYDRQLR